MPDSNCTDKGLKRKRSPSPQQLRSSDYPTPSPPESFEAVVKTEEQEQELVLYQKQEQEPRTGHEPDDCLFRSATLPNDAHTSLLPPNSSSLPYETSLSKYDPEIEIPAPASPHYKEQGTQTEVELPETEAYFNWSGRGRSPFKTPAIAALDGLKRSAKLVEWIERETVKERIELEKVIRYKKYCFTGIARARFEIAQDKMNPLNNLTILTPDVDQFHGKSPSPNKYIAKMKVSNPPVHHETMETYRLGLPEQMEELLALLEEKLGEGCIPSTYEVIRTMILRDRIAADIEYRLR